MYNERRCNYLKNSVEEKTEGRKLNLEERKEELKKERTHSWRKKCKKIWGASQKRKKAKTVWTKFNVMNEKSVSPTPSIENPGNRKMTRQLTKCTKTEYRWWRTSEKIKWQLTAWWWREEKINKRPSTM